MKASAMKNDPRVRAQEKKDVSLGAGVSYEFYKRFTERCEEVGRHKSKIVRALLEMWMHGDIDLKDDFDFITKREMNEKLDELKKEILLSLQPIKVGDNNQ